MKLMTLNIWGGHVEQPLLEFIQKHRDVDIICLQEVYANAPKKISTEDRKVNLNILAEIQAILSDHTAYFRPVVENIFGIGTFIKSKYEVLGEGDITIHNNPNYSGGGPTHSRNLQWLEYKGDGHTYSVLHVHALWNGNGKTDTPDRLAQSQRIRNFMNAINTPIIMCGDFNLRPDTESVSILEKGMRNLIKEYDIQSTRSSLYTKAEKFADYIFTSPQIKVNAFDVLPDEVSDHLALVIDYN